MGGIRKKGKPPGKENNKPKKASPKPAEDDDYEDGDIATPKRDRYGEDDEPSVDRRRKSIRSSDPRRLKARTSLFLRKPCAERPCSSRIGHAG